MATRPGIARPTFLHSDRRLARATQPFVRFLHIEAAGGILLFIATVAALIWANSPWQESYETLWSSVIRVQARHPQSRDCCDDGLRRRLGPRTFAGIATRAPASRGRSRPRSLWAMATAAPRRAALCRRALRWRGVIVSGHRTRSAIPRCCAKVARDAHGSNTRTSTAPTLPPVDVSTSKRTA